MPPWVKVMVVLADAGAATAVIALASRVDGRRLWVAAGIAGGLFLAGEVRGKLAGQGTGNVLPAVCSTS